MFNLESKRQKRYKIIQKYYPGLIRPEHIYAGEVGKRLSSGSVVLELGCGRNPASAVKDSVVKAKLFTGLDLDLNHLKQAKENCRPVYGNAQVLPFKDCSFDMIFCRSVLEHVETPEVMVKEIERVLKPGGNFVFLTPNKWAYFAIVSRLIPDKFHGAIVKKIYGRDEEDTFKTHYLINSRGQIRMLLKKTGLIEDRIIMMQQYPVELWFSLILLYMGILFEKIVNKYETFSFLRSNIIGCYRK